MSRNLKGTYLGKYKLKEIIGEGSFATVYKAYEPKLERSVAIKILHITRNDILDRFEREAKAVALLRHPNILVVYEFDEANRYPYIAMEHVAGGSLENSIQEGPLEWTQVVKIAFHVAGALHHAHQHNLVHRDVKPSNVLMRSENWPLLADFGMVKVTNPDKAITSSYDILGTPAYVAPEQIESSKSAGPEADIYSLGAIMFEMITGRLPFGDRHPSAQILAHLSEDVPKPREFNAECPPELQTIIMKAMEKMPEDRYDDLQAMSDALESLVDPSILMLSSTPISGMTTQRMPKIPPKLLTDHETSTRPSLESQPRFQGNGLLIVDTDILIGLPDFDLGKDGLIIGRTYDNVRADVDLSVYPDVDYEGVSRHHARLTQQANEWFIDDLHSLNGTYVNEIKINPGSPVLLKNNDVIRCSMVALVFRDNRSAV